MSFVGGRWLGFSLLVGLAAALSSACGSSDGGGSSYCDTLISRQRECGIRGDGQTNCQNYGDSPEPCETRCTAQATCADLVANSCSPSASNALAICYAQCVGEAPVSCADGSTVAGWARCNGFSECGDGSDELDCATINSGFKCRSVDQFVDGAKFCDGHKDCLDGSDENADCAPGRKCLVNGTLTQLTVSDDCNGTSQCDDASDEPLACAPFACPNR